MTTPISPRLLRGGLVVVDPDSGAVQRVITLQYNPDSLSRAFQLKASGADGAAHSEALRLTGPPVQTITVEAELDAADQLEFPASNAETVASGWPPSWPRSRPSSTRRRRRCRTPPR